MTGGARGMAAVDMGPGEAGEVARLQRQLRAHPGSLQFVALGEALRSRGRLGEARAVLEQGLRLHPELRSARILLARILAGLGERAAALALLEPLVPAEPANAALDCLTAELLLAEGHLARAEGLLDRLEQVAPAEPSLRSLRRELAARRAARRGGDPFLSPRLAERLERAGRYRRAAEVWRALAELGDASAHLTRAAHATSAAERLPPSPGETPVPPGREGRPGEVGRLRGWLERLDAHKARRA